MSERLVGGDERGLVTAEFSVEALTAFLAMVNGAHIVTDDGYLHEFAAEEYEPGRVYITDRIYNVGESR